MDDVKNSEASSLLVTKSAGFQVYRRRWVMLAIFVIFGLSNNFLSLQYASISDTVATFYNVPTSTVDLLSTVCYIVYLVAIIPIMWLTKTHGLKVILLLGTSSQFVGSWIRFIGTCTRSIALNFIGQVLCGIGQPCTYGMSSQVAGTWFGIYEVSLANGIGFSGVEIGVGFVFIIPSLLVQDGPHVCQQMEQFFLYTAIVMSFILLLTIFVFESKPPLPPSRPKMKAIKAGKQDNYLQSLKVILRNRNFILLLVAFALSSGFGNALETLLQDWTYSSYFSDSSKIVRRVGVMKIISAVFGPLLAGTWLDKTKRFRSTTILITILLAVCLLVLSLSMKYSNEFLTTVSIGMFFFLMITFFIVGTEYAVELTYPESEIMSSGVMVASCLVIAIIWMFTIDYLFSGKSLFFKTSCCFVVQLIPILCTIFIEKDYKRQNADKDHEEDNLDMNVLQEETNIN